MQSASSLFLTRADAHMRPINWALFISFARSLDDTASFFTAGVSTVGGPDIIKGTDDVLQLWDQYQYYDYSDRVVTLEWQQSMDPLYSVQSAMGDIVLSNTDAYLSGDNFALPWRPLRLSAGFGNAMTGNPELLPQFVGVTEEAPTIDIAAGTVSYHVIDFMSTLENRQLSNDVMLQNVTTDVALDALLQDVGLSPTQYDLDPGFNVIPFVYFAAGTLFGDAAQQLMQAEMGRLYMTETGRITFHNRQNFSDVSVWYFDRHNVIDYQTATQDQVINVVTITANIREVQPLQPYWQTSTLLTVPAGASVEMPFASFADPVTSVDTPVPYVDSSTSYYIANTQPDGSGDDVSTGITLATTEFSTSYLITFTNSNAYDVYITDVHLYATPAIADRTIQITEQNDVSVAQYDEQVLQIDNDFFMDEATAISKANIILADNATFNQLQTVTVKANPALQINDAAYFSIRQHSYISESGDTLPSIATSYSMTLIQLEALNPTVPTSGALTIGTEIQLGIIPELCTILGISSKLDSPKFTQDLTVKPMDRTDYFTAGISTVGGTDVIAP